MLILKYVHGYKILFACNVLVWQKSYFFMVLLKTLSIQKMSADFHGVDLVSTSLEIGKQRLPHQILIPWILT